MSNLTTFSDSSKEPPDVVFNWHLLEPCNYKCEYCFAKWEKPVGDTREVYRDRNKVIQLLEQFSSVIPKIPGKVRLNIAGGEPMILNNRKNDLGFIIDEAHKRGLLISMITNGSRLKDDFIYKHGQFIECLGISVDSLDSETNIKIGRRNQKGETLSGESLGNLICLMRNQNSDVRIKINTVVNKINYQENMSDFLTRVKPDRFKILKMLPSITTRLEINDSQFKTFCDIHRKWIDDGVAVVEDNDDMSESYFMVDPLGRFFQNKSGKEQGYDYSHFIIEKGIISASSEIQLNFDRYKKRY